VTITPAYKITVLVVFAEPNGEENHHFGSLLTSAGELAPTRSVPQKPATTKRQSNSVQRDTRRNGLVLTQNVPDGVAAGIDEEYLSTMPHRLTGILGRSLNPLQRARVASAHSAEGMRESASVAQARPVALLEGSM
jgi:hypothetical protein